MDDRKISIIFGIILLFVGMFFLAILCLSSFSVTIQKIISVTGYILTVILLGIIGCACSMYGIYAFRHLPGDRPENKSPHHGLTPMVF